MVLGVGVSMRVILVLLVRGCILRVFSPIIYRLLYLEVAVLIKSVQDVTDRVVVDVALLRNGHGLQVMDQVVVDYGDAVVVVYELVAVALDFAGSGILLEFEKFVRWHFTNLVVFVVCTSFLVYDYKSCLWVSI